MDHAAQLVDLVDEHGSMVSTKIRKDIQKATDLFHTILVLVVTPDGQIVLSKIPARSDLPNLYAHSLGATAATIRRHGESAEAAAIRAAQQELRIIGPKPEKLGESFEVFTDGSRKYMTLFRVANVAPVDFSRTDIESLQLLSRDELLEHIQTQPDLFAPTFLRMWKRHLSSTQR
jgi:8-oxo-dGTP pyrophosphatase MutT (NUDIX family)